MHVTAVTPRWFYPNIRRKRIFVPELGKFVDVKCTARALKTIAKNGAYATLLKAGLVKPARRRSQTQKKTETQAN